MTRSDTIILTFIYPGCEKYIYDFIDSLLHQTEKDFDVLMVNDGIQISDIPYIPFKHQIIDCSLSISKNREFGILRAIELGYKHLILSDIDDYFYPSRIEKLLLGLKTYDAVVSDLTIVSSDKRILDENYFQLTHSIPSKLYKEFLDEQNICGFSNTAINIKSIPKFSFPDNLKIVDWYFFSILLNQGLSIGFINQSLTYYRQHGDNLIGIDDFSIDLFKKMLPMKILHYEFMSEYDDRFSYLYNRYSKMITSQDSEIERAIKKNKIINNKPLWWENLKI